MRIKKMIVKVEVDCQKSIAELTKAVKCDMVNSDINDNNFPLTEKGKQEKQCVLIRANEKALDNPDEYLNKFDLKPGKLEDLLAFGAKFPESGFELPIFALGSKFSSIHGNRRYPVLCNSFPGQRCLSLGEFSWQGWSHQRMHLCVHIDNVRKSYSEEVFSDCLILAVSK